MPELHLPTILAILAVVGLVQASVMLLLTQVAEDYAGVRLWAAGMMCFAGGCIALLLREVTPLLPSVILTNLLTQATPALLLDGTRRFLGRPAGRLVFMGYAVAALAVVVQVVFTLNDQLNVRVLINSLVIASLTLYTAWLLLHHSPLHLRSMARFTAMAFTLVGIVAAVRGIGSVLSPLPTIDAPTVPQVFAVLGTLAGSLLAVAGLGVMIAQRLLGDLRASQRLVQGLLDHAPIGIGVREVGGRYRMLNRRLIQALWSVPKDTALEPASLNRAPGGLPAVERRHDTQLLAGAAAVTSEHAVEIHDRPVIARMTSFALRDGDGPPYAVGSLVLDVTHQRALEADLRSNELLALRRVGVLEDLSATLAEISAEQALAPLLQTIVVRVARLLEADTAELLLYDEERGDLALVARHPADPRQAMYRQRIGEGAMGRVAETRQSLIMNDYKAWGGALPGDVTHGLAAVLDVPLLRGEQLVGVLGVGSVAPGRLFSVDDEQLLTLFARQATVAILNARLYEQLRLDPLTQLNNRGRFFELAEALIGEAQRGRQPLAAALVDVDRFKSINDTYGHAVGDVVLRWVAAHMADSAPAGAVCGRIGGEEFAVLLPGVGAGEALGCLDALRVRVEAVPAAAGELSLPVTVSIGLTALADGDTQVDQLLLRADRALYLAKSAGRNRVCQL